MADVFGTLARKLQKNRLRAEHASSEKTGVKSAHTMNCRSTSTRKHERINRQLDTADLIEQVIPSRVNIQREMSHLQRKAGTVSRESDAMPQTVPEESMNLSYTNIEDKGKSKTMEYPYSENIAEMETSKSEQPVAQEQDKPYEVSSADADGAMQDDYLLGKIDEFREKAKLLQQLLVTKESKVKELQVIVEEREGKAEKLQQIVNERQKRADGISAAVTEKIDVLIDQVTEKMSTMENSIRNEVVNGNRVSSEQAHRLDDSMEDISSQLETLEAAIKNINTNVQSFDASMKSIDTRVQSMDTNFREIDSSIQAIDSSVKSVDTNVQSLDTNVKSLDTNFNGITDDIDEISEKIHSENVKSYRNTVDLFKELDDKLDRMEELQRSISTVKTVAVGAVAVTVINLLVTIFLVVMNVLL